MDAEREDHYNKNLLECNKMMIYANLSEIMINGGLSYLF